MTDLMPEDPRVTWILWLAVLVAFLLAFSVGANDVSNSFGTSVGSGVLTVTQACMLATFFEVAGSTLLGHQVCDFFRTNMYQVELYKGAQDQLMIGALGCLVGSALWNFIATKLKMPISGTHSVIGATLGFNLVLLGMDSIQWRRIGLVVASWFISPLISGVISSIIFLVISKKIIAQIKPLDNGLKALPLFYGITIFINVASLTINGPDIFGINKLPWYAGLAISLLACALAICYTAISVAPRVKDRIINEMQTAKPVKPTTLPIIKINNDDNNDKNNASQEEPEKQEESEKQDGGQLNPAFEGSESHEMIEIKNKPGKKSRPSPPTLQRQLACDKKTLDEGDEDESNQVKARLTTDENGIKDADKSYIKRVSIVAPNEENVEEDKSVQEKLQDTQIDISEPPSPVKTGGPKLIAGERIEVFRLFSSLQILTACFASFAHGTNDVSNAVAPLIPIWNIWERGYEDTSEPTQPWLLLFGGIGICAGLWAWGRAVMRTVGTGLTQLTPSKGFSIELGAAISVLFASKIGIPISTTHCKVGSLVILGMVSDRYCAHDSMQGLSRGTRRISRLWAEGILSEDEDFSSGKVDWKLFGSIAITWIVTVPLSAIAAAIATLILRALAPSLS